jgi:hypothetical protein
LVVRCRVGLGFLLFFEHFKFLQKNFVFLRETLQLAEQLWLELIELSNDISIWIVLDELRLGEVGLCNW